ncbi:MAG: hypothetical protein GF411_10045 [Candidatus Lokiarchaeota archaeon]|nr:hypothetical protein [Candidatus Lokiarchaeota archaeon]
MRYALGILVGFILSGIVFIGYGYLKLLGIGVTDYIALQGLWGLFLLWTVIAIAILAAPLLLLLVIRRSSLREFFLFEVGGLALFSPLWFLLISEVTGTSITEVLIDGVSNALPSVGGDGTIVAADMGGIILSPILLAMMIFGIIILRPSFILEHSISTPREKKKREKSEEPKSIEETMPEVSPPKADEESIAELKQTLSEIGIGDQSVDALLNAGFSSVTEVIAASPNNLAQALGTDRKSAEEIQLKVQKIAFFGGL